MFLVQKTPADDPRISVEEREYIESTVGRQEVKAKLKISPNLEVQFILL